ncbi:MAG: hypothetical protein WBQ21_13570 [Solirubrobacteraceae bacterium]
MHAPQLRLIDRVADELETSPLELLDGSLDVFDLEVDACSVVNHLVNMMP